MMQQLKNYYKNNFKLFLSRTNMHGFGELILSPSFHGKLFWILSLTVCLGFTTYQLSEACLAYVHGFMKCQHPGLIMHRPFAEIKFMFCHQAIVCH